MFRALVLTLIYGFYFAASDDKLVGGAVAPLALLLILRVAAIATSYATTDDMFCFIIFAFFVVSPMQAYSHEIMSSDYLQGYYFSYREFFVAMAIVLLFTLFYNATLDRLRAMNLRVAVYDIESKYAPGLLLLSGLAFLGYVVTSGGIGNVMASRYDKLDVDTGVLPQLMLGIEVTTFVMLFSIYVKTRDIIIFLLWGMAALCMAVAQNPYNTARNFLFIIYFPIILMYLRGRLPATILYLGVVFGIIFVMPITEYTSRRGASLSEAMENFNFDEVAASPLGDVFETLLYAVRWFETNSFAYGNRTLGLLLFFVPRAWWAGKAPLTGLDIGNDLYERHLAGTFNLSFFVGGDFYADGGLFAVGVGAMLAALIVYLTFYRRVAVVNGAPIKIYLLMGSLPILIRGPVGANAELIVILILCFNFLLRFIGRKADLGAAVPP